jgi:flagellar motor switch protein FliM
LANVLTQNEINELLNALASGRDTTVEKPPDEGAAEVKLYNFRTANKFPKEQIRMLNFIYDNYAGRLATYLSGTLRAICEVEVASIEEQTFSEFNNSLPSPAFLAIIHMDPLNGSALLDVSPAVAYEIISRIFGGTGYFHENQKMFTEIEISILSRIVHQMLSLMGESWDKVAKVNAKLDRIETSAQFAQIVPANEPIAIITMNIKIGEVSDIINLCIPHMAIQPVAKQLAMKMWYADAPAVKNDMNIDNISPRIANTQLTLHAVLDGTSATVKDIVNLQVGDVIRVDHPIDKHITVMVEHIPKFKGAVGVLGKRYAVKISDIQKEETEDE